MAQCIKGNYMQRNESDLLFCMGLDVNYGCIAGPGIATPRHTRSHPINPETNGISSWTHVCGAMTSQDFLHHHFFFLKTCSPSWSPLQSIHLLGGWLWNVYASFISLISFALASHMHDSHIFGRWQYLRRLEILEAYFWSNVDLFKNVYFFRFSFILNYGFHEKMQSWFMISSSCWLSCKWNNSVLRYFVKTPALIVLEAGISDIGQQEVFYMAITLRTGVILLCKS